MNVEIILKNKDYIKNKIVVPARYGHFEVAKVRKPAKRFVHDGAMECHSEEYDDHGGGAFCVEVDCPSLYSSEEVRKVIRFLIKAEKWIANKELYKKIKGI